MYYYSNEKYIGRIMIVVIFFVSYMLIVRLTERMADIDKVTDQRRFSPIIAITVNI